MIFILCDDLKGYLSSGLSKLAIDVKFFYQLPPTREIFYDYQFNLMSFVKIHPRHTGKIQCPVLCPRILHRHTYSVSQHNVSTAVFHPTAVEHSQTYCLQASTLLFFLEKGVGSIMTK